MTAKNILQVCKIKRNTFHDLICNYILTRLWGKDLDNTLGNEKLIHTVIYFQYS